MKTIFRIVSFLEGISYLLLLFVAVPIKYYQANEAYVKMLGMPHGILFMLYIVLAFVMQTSQKWKKNDFALILVASIVPFGTFYVDKKYLR